MLHCRFQVGGAAVPWGKLTAHIQAFFVFCQAVPFTNRQLPRLVVEKHRHFAGLVRQCVFKRPGQNDVAIGIGVIEDRGVAFKNPLFPVTGEFDFCLVEGQRFYDFRHYGPHKN